MTENHNSRALNKSLKEYARGIAGGLLFSFPLLYTMEVWWTGFIADPLDLMILVVVTYLLLLGYNRFAGMHPDASWKHVFIDSVEEMGIGLLISFGVLLMLNRIRLSGMGIDEVMGKVIIEAMAVSIGVSIGTAQLGANEEEEKRQKSRERKTKVGFFVLGICGAIIVGGNVAPTEEIVMIAMEAAPGHILAMALVSLLISIIVVFFSDFKGTARRSRNGLLFDMTFDTCVSYITALGVSAFVLWFFGRFDGVSFWVAFQQVVVLGVLSSLGASAGRLLIK
ncbi:putative integral membrane protein (TIGR02587 family) [Pontibacter aydingkolensis]|uniref:TIGR02587 family membrane protein n=1 Tax=Pontibacter aydingkolensis TaxID=1911536 RepID=A0ABS7CXV6_9BACT|nr:TIGR02587 family membrane protein [Pontibacter aydingkolensis]MBW7468689.1 TIGR02587 family membrane protein [Pontibacter aydingkolensis]